MLTIWMAAWLSHIPEARVSSHGKSWVSQPSCQHQCGSLLQKSMWDCQMVSFSAGPQGLCTELLLHRHLSPASPTYHLHSELPGFCSEWPSFTTETEGQKHANTNSDVFERVDGQRTEQDGMSVQSAWKQSATLMAGDNRKWSWP